MTSIIPEFARRLWQDAPMGQVITDIEFRVVAANATYQRLAGRSMELLEGVSVHDLVHGEDLGEVVVGGMLLRFGRLPQFERDHRLVQPDGSIVWVHSMSAPILGEDGQVTHLMSFCHDISARREAEQALRASEAQVREILDALQEGIVVQDAHSHILAFNQAAREMLMEGTEPLTHVQPGTLHWDALDAHGNALAAENQPAWRALRTGETQEDAVLATRQRDGTLRLFSVRAKPLFRPGATEPYATVSTLIDVTERRSSEQALAASEERFRSLAEALPMALFRTDEEGRYTYVNPIFEQLTGVSLQTRPRLLDVVHPDDRTEVLHAIRESISTGRFHARFRMVAADGEVRWANSHAVPARRDERMVGFIGCVEDVTPLVEAQEETSRLAAIVESTSDAIAVIEPGGHVVYLNSAARERLGHGFGILDGLRLEHLFTDLGSRLDNEILPAVDKGTHWSGELTMAGCDDDPVVVSATVVPERDATGRLIRLAVISRDISGRKKIEAALTHQANHDSLTGLPNRALFLELLELACSRAALIGRPLALLFLDLDRFKWVNDRLGHEVGDELLRAVAQRLHLITRDGDTVARLGGDEFVILCPGVRDEEEAVMVAGRVLGALERQPFVSGDVELPITASVGIAMSTGNDHPEGLLREADAAMYRAKAQGRARFELFDDAMRARTQRRTELAEQLARGIARGEIVCWYQPTVDIRTGEYVGVEALARWEHPSRGLLPPSEFIELAEETGLIGALGASVLSQAAQQTKAWADEFGARAPIVHVNLSPRQLAYADLVVEVAELIRETGVDTRLLCLEITENALVDDVESAVAALNRLKELGVRIAIDDFGTGYSSLAYLRRFPVDVLKVDRSFVDGLGPDPEDSAIVSAIVKLAHTLELESVAEGVETQAQLDQLRAMGCDLAQGYLFSRPLPVEEATELLRVGRSAATVPEAPTPAAPLSALLP